MEKLNKGVNPFVRNNLHRRQLSDSSYSSLTLSTSHKNLSVDRLPTENSHRSSQCASPLSAGRIKEPVNKAISLVIIEKYFSDICQNIASKNLIEKSLLSKAVTMQDVLKDCLTAVPDISLQFYVLMASALKEIQQIYTTQDVSLYTTLAKKLVQIAGLLEENNYTSDIDRVTTLPNEELSEVRGLKNIGQELLIKVSRVTARILNIWKKILSPQREAAVISCSFLLLYCEVDGSLKILPTSRIPAEKAVSSMKLYLNNPGYVVTVIRKTKEFIENEQISVETVRRIHDLLEKVTIEQVKNMDKTLTGLAIYELVLYAVKYYQEYAREHYKIDIFEEGKEEKDRESLSRSPVREEVKSGVDSAPRLRSLRIATKCVEGNEVRPAETSVEKPQKELEKGKPLSSPLKPTLQKPKLPERTSRIVEKNPKVAGTVMTHHKSRSALYSPSGLPKETQRSNSNSSSKNLLPDRKSLNIFRK